MTRSGSGSDSAPTGTGGGDARSEDAFLSRFWSDADRERVMPLAYYLSSHPGLEELVAEEWLSWKHRQRSEAGTITSVDFLSPRHHQHGGSLGSIGEFRLIREIGRGGQARVFLAHDRRLNRRVAVKVFDRLVRAPRADLDRFRREAEITSNLEHPNICPIHAIGTEPVPYIAMRFVDGETFSQRIRRARGEHGVDGRPEEESSTRVGRVEDPREDDGRLDEVSCLRDHSGRVASVRFSASEFDRTLRGIEGVARALHVAHEEGVIHRDIKPGNIMLDRADEPVILDFGLAVTDERFDREGSRTRALEGTPHYMSPEQLDRDNRFIDRRTDVYSLGVTLYECLTLVCPYEVSTPDGIYAAIRRDSPRDPRRLNASISRDLHTVILTAMEKDRGSRYQTALELAEDLHRVRTGQAVKARRRSWISRAARAAVVNGRTTLALALIVGLSAWVVHLLGRLAERGS